MFNFLKTKKAQNELEQLNELIKAKNDLLISLDEKITSQENLSLKLTGMISNLMKTHDGLFEMEDLGLAYTPISTNPDDIERAINKTESAIAKLIGSGEAIEVLTNEFNQEVHKNYFDFEEENT